MTIYIVVDADTNEYYDAFASEEQAQQFVNNLEPTDFHNEELFELKIITKTL